LWSVQLHRAPLRTRSTNLANTLGSARENDLHPSAIDILSGEDDSRSPSLQLRTLAVKLTLDMRKTLIFIVILFLIAAAIFALVLVVPIIKLADLNAGATADAVPRARPAYDKA